MPFWKPGFTFVAVDVLADIPNPPREVPIQVDKGDFETLRQKSTDRALACSTRGNQANLIESAHDRPEGGPAPK
jgi:hypothetical protein